MTFVRFAFALIALAAVQMDGRAAQAISGGHPAAGREFGFVRVLKIDWSDGKASTCTGSAIGPRLVLTAAHCVVRPTGERLTAIEVRPKKSRPGIRVRAVQVHARYHRGEERGFLMLENDLAMLEMSEAIDGPYAMTPFDYLWRRHRDVYTGPFKRLFLEQITVAEAKALLDKVLTRDEKGRPYAAQVGFGLFGCARSTKKCSSSGSMKARYVEKYLFNYRTDRPLIPVGCEPTPFSLSTPGVNLICVGVSADDTRSPTTFGPDRLYTAQPGDSGGPAVVFGENRQAFVIGTMSFGGLETKSINMNLVEHLDFLRDVVLGGGPTLRRIDLE